jgi:hypothetical protein
VVVIVKGKFNSKGDGEVYLAETGKRLYRLILLRVVLRNIHEKYTVVK